MSWLRLDLPGIGSRIENEAIERFDRLWMQAGAPPGAALLMTKNPLAAPQSLFTTPQSEPFAGLLMRGLGAVECEAPNLRGVTLLRGHAEEWGNY